VRLTRRRPASAETGMGDVDAVIAWQTLTPATALPDPPARAQASASDDRDRSGSVTFGLVQAMVLRVVTIGVADTCGSRRAVELHRTAFRAMSNSPVHCPGYVRAQPRHCVVAQRGELAR